MRRAVQGRESAGQATGCWGRVWVSPFLPRPGREGLPAKGEPGPTLDPGNPAARDRGLQESRSRGNGRDTAMARRITRRRWQVFFTLVTWGNAGRPVSQGSAADFHPDNAHAGFRRVGLSAQGSPSTRTSGCPPGRLAARLMFAAGTPANPCSVGWVGTMDKLGASPGA